MFYICEINKKKLIKSTIIPEFEDCFTTRDFVITSNEKDMKETIKQNKNELFKYLKVSSNKIIRPIQTHSSNVAFAQKNKYKYPDTDAIILTRKKQTAIMNFADCTPIILYDKKLNIAALVHAGWRGTVNKIVMKTIFKIEQEFNSDIDNMVAVIGPTIGKCCYEVGENV